MLAPALLSLSLIRVASVAFTWSSITQAATSATTSADASEETTTQTVGDLMVRPKDVDLSSAFAQAYEDKLYRPTKTKRVPIAKKQQTGNDSFLGKLLRQFLNKAGQSSNSDAVSILASIIKALLVSFACAGVIWLLIRLKKLKPLQWPFRRKRATLAAVSPTQTSLTQVNSKNLLNQLTQLWQQGQHRAALALLYQSSLTALAQTAGAAILPSNTEADCLQQLTYAEPATQSVRQAVIQCWQQAAYAGRYPDDQQFEHLVAQAAQRFGWTTS